MKKRGQKQFFLNSFRGLCLKRKVCLEFIQVISIFLMFIDILTSWHSGDQNYKTHFSTTHDGRLDQR